MIHYYFSVMPVEALIASELPPEAFGSYMATGSHKGSAEQLIFMEIEPGFGTDFDWDYAKARCVPHPDGRPKQSVYLSIHRVLERIPTDRMGALYLVTRDGRSLRLEKTAYQPEADWKGPALYKELCPVIPLVAASLDPQAFGVFMTTPERKIHVPAIIFADIRIIDMDNLRDSGHVGTVSKQELEHVRHCIETVRDDPEKMTKTVDRSFISKFTYQTIANGIYVSTGSGIVSYLLPPHDVLIKTQYDWCRSANMC